MIIISKRDNGDTVVSSYSVTGQDAGWADRQNGLFNINGWKRVVPCYDYMNMITGQVRTLNIFNGIQVGYFTW